tara:strand:- start:193 stop:519 length:327 start_codon:yes stop_codon:yes gene_type:complete
MSITQQIEQLIDEGESQKAERMFRLYFAVSPQQAKKCIQDFQQEGRWLLPPVPNSLEEIENQVRVLWRDCYVLNAIEFYRLHTGCSLKESSDRVQRLCADISREDDEN